MNPDETQRLDKWLWAARFFKTRSLAAAALRSGKVALNGERAKPAKLVSAGESVRIRRGPFEIDIPIIELAKRRGSTVEAATLYRETDVSRERRDVLSEHLKAEAGSRDLRISGRPTKRDRRNLQKFKRQD